MSAIAETTTLNPSQPNNYLALYGDYSLPDYGQITGVDSVVPGKPVSQDSYGTTYIDKWQMSDERSTQYKVMRCLSSKPSTGLWVVKDTAWATQVTGLNEDVARLLMRDGFNVLIKGPEIGSSIPLSQSAFNTHLILDAMSERGDIEADFIAVEGYSRGSMIAFGTNAYADRFRRKVVYSNLTDPCIALPIGPNLESAKKAATLPADLALLGIAVAKGLVQANRTRNLLRTIDASADGVKQFVRTGIPLMNGEAGMMAACTSEDMQATIAFFRQCRVNDHKVFEQILADRPGVRFVHPEGGHGGAIDTRIIGNIAVRFGRIAEQIAEGQPVNNLDYRHIINGIKLVK